MHTKRGRRRTDAWRQDWPDYVRHHAGNVPNAVIAEKAHVDKSTVSRWFPGENQSRPRAEHVVGFARGYNRPRVEALIVAGYLTPDELDPTRVIELGVSLPDLTADELLDEVRRRMVDRGSAPITEVDDVDGILDSIADPVGRNRLKKRGQRA